MRPSVYFNIDPAENTPVAQMGLELGDWLNRSLIITEYIAVSTNAVPINRREVPMPRFLSRRRGRKPDHSVVAGILRPQRENCIQFQLFTLKP
ncbi:MAG: hypothetical protein EOP09_15860 [Proteobacteria bacterium]|nr:MAG: hypothetical protein EOP09_15860 [Pseudomonadota bacterium]